MSGFAGMAITNEIGAKRVTSNIGTWDRRGLCLYNSRVPLKAQLLSVTFQESTKRLACGKGCYK
jgi:hypothetical protein